MTKVCIHGFAPEHCGSCRVCPHGFVTSRCARCADPVAARADAKVTPAPEDSQEHRGSEVFFVPEDRSWYYRDGPDAAVSPQSYRSAFQAKRAIDATRDAPPPKAASKKAKKNS